MTPLMGFFLRCLAGLLLVLLLLSLSDYVLARDRAALPGAVPLTRDAAPTGVQRGESAAGPGATSSPVRARAADRTRT